MNSFHMINIYTSRGDIKSAFTLIKTKSESVARKIMEKAGYKIPSLSGKAFWLHIQQVLIQASRSKTCGYTARLPTPGNHYLSMTDVSDRDAEPPVMSSQATQCQTRQAKAPAEDCLQTEAPPHAADAKTAQKTPLEAVRAERVRVTRQNVEKRPAVSSGGLATFEASNRRHCQPVPCSDHTTERNCRICQDRVPEPESKPHLERIGAIFRLSQTGKQLYRLISEMPNRWPCWFSMLPDLGNSRPSEQRRAVIPERYAVHKAPACVSIQTADCLCRGVHHGRFSLANRYRNHRSLLAKPLRYASSP